MKDKTMAYLLWISVGLVCLGIGIANLFPLLKDVINDAVVNGPH